MGNELAAYFDDSGHPDDQDVVVVAGWVGKVDQWRLWEQGWTKVLRDYKIASGIFHMTDFEAALKSERANEYKHLSLSQRASFHSRLISHVRTRASYTFCVMVPMRDYKYVNEMYCFEEWLGKPYTFASIGITQTLRAWKQLYQPKSPLVTYFEDGTKHKGDLMAAFKQFKFDDPIFRKKKEAVPLQAADMLAWECFNAFNTGEVRAQFDDLLETVPGRRTHGIFTADRLVEAAESSEVPKRESSKNVAFYFTSSPKVRRMRQITRPSVEKQIWGAERSGGGAAENLWKRARSSPLPR